jgi:hypothetical protein
MSAKPSAAVLPELPEPISYGSWSSCVKCQEYPAPIFSADQMRDYALAAIEASRADALDAARWRMLRKILRSGMTPSRSEIKCVEVCPMYGEEKRVDIERLVDAAFTAQDAK